MQDATFVKFVQFVAAANSRRPANLAERLWHGMS